MSSTTGQQNRRGNRPSGHGSRKPRPAPPPPPPKHPFRTWAAKGVKAASRQMIGLVALVIALLTLVITHLTLVNQIQANSAQDKVNRANAAAEMRQIAERVSFYPQAGHGKNFVLVIANRSFGLIRDVELMMPAPVQGCSAKCDWVGSYWFTLPDVPPCSIAVTSGFKMFRNPANPKQPLVGPTTLNGSHLNFTDPNGNSWALFSGDSRLDLLTGYKAQAGFSWGGFATVAPASGCS